MVAFNGDNRSNIHHNGESECKRDENSGNGECGKIVMKMIMVETAKIGGEDDYSL